MNHLKLVLLVAALALPVSSTQALEWIVYDGTTPDNAVMLNDGTEDAVVCRHNAKVGLVTDAGLCHSVALGSTKVKKKTQDDGYEILVDNSESEIETAVAEATEDMYTQDQYDAATDGMYTQAEYDSNALECTTTVKWMEYCSDVFKGGDCTLHDNTYPRSSEEVNKTIMIVNGVYFIAQSLYYDNKMILGFDRISASRVSQPDVTCDGDVGECTWTE